jgi:hypothetical protein
MENDRLRLFNVKLIDTIRSLNDDELWNFLLEREDRIKQLQYPGGSPATGFFYAYPHGMEHFRKHFLMHIGGYREGVVFSLVVDFCFEGEPVKMDYWARCGFLDSADSCDVKTSDEIMPPVDEDSEEAYHSEYFHLLEPRHIENIIRAMEKNFDKLTINTREDIDKLKEMKQKCLSDEAYKAAYIYNTSKY